MIAPAFRNLINTFPVKMLPLGYSDFANSPSILLRPHHHQFHPIERHNYLLQYQPFESVVPANFDPPFLGDEMNSPQAEPEPDHGTSLTDTPKKRKYDDSTLLDDPPDEPVSTSQTVNSPVGMQADLPHIDPFTSAAPTAASQSGSFFEDKLQEGLAAQMEGSTSNETETGEDMHVRKVPRREFSSSSGAVTGDGSSGAPRAGPAEPVVDDYTRELGIGWTQTGNDPDVVAATRGFERYIINHYPLRSAKILLKSKSLDAYLVTTNEGFFLFREDLAQGRLVATTWEKTLANLKDKEVVFDGTHVLFAKKMADLSRNIVIPVGKSDASVPEADVDMD